jgi:hypothetical protein
LNQNEFRYDSGHYLISAVDRQFSGDVSEASEQKSYLNLRIILDPALVAVIMMETPYRK